MAVLGLSSCARAFSSCGKRGPLFIAVRGPLFIAVHGPFSIAAALVAEHRLQTRRLSNGGSRAQLLRGMWDPPRPGLEPVSPALAGRFSTTAPPGKPYLALLRKSGPTPDLWDTIQKAFKGTQPSGSGRASLITSVSRCLFIQFLQHFLENTRLSLELVVSSSLRFCQLRNTLPKR